MQHWRSSSSVVLLPRIAHLVCSRADFHSCFPDFCHAIHQTSQIFSCRQHTAWKMCVFSTVRVTLSVLVKSCQLFYAIGQLLQGTGFGICTPSAPSWRGFDFYRLVKLKSTPTWMSLEDTKWLGSGL